MNLKKFKVVTDWCTPRDLVGLFAPTPNPNELIVNHTKEIYFDVDKILWITEGDHEELTEITIEGDSRFDVLGNVEEVIKHYNLRKEL